jgi:glycine oxidase
MRQRPASVVVIGGGVFGSSTAFHLAKHGIATTLIERDGIGSHASGKNPGNLNPILGSPSELVPLALRSLVLHQALALELADLGCADYALEPLKRVLLAFDDLERDDLNATALRYRGIPGFSATLLDQQSVIQLDRRLSRNICAGLLIEGNMSLDSRAFSRAMVDAATRSGASLLRANVTDLDKSNDRVIGVSTTEGGIACDSVVFATGPWVAEIRDWLGFSVPVTPIKGQILKVCLSDEPLRCDFTRGLISLYRRGPGECWIGVTKESRGLDETPTEAAKRHLLQAAADIMPAVRLATALEQMASLRPVSASGLPVVGRAPCWKNVYIANGGGIKGILLCSGIGIAVAEMVSTGTTAMPIEQFQIPVDS